MFLVIQRLFLLSYTPDTLFDPKPIYIPPVPELSPYGMLLTELGLLGFMAHRRKQIVNTQNSKKA